MKNTNTPISTAIIKDAISMAWPAVFESFFVAMIGMVDSFMVSNLGYTAVAAVGLTTQPKFLGLAIFFALNTSLTAIVARRRGEQKQKEANQVLLVAMISNFILGLIISTLCVVFANEIISLCGSDATTHDDAVTYYRIIMGGMMFSVLSMGINSAQRGCGKTRISMVTNLTSNTVNVIFNYLLIEGHFGFPALGIKGAAIATVLGTIVACVMSFLSLRHYTNFLSIPYLIKHKVHTAIKPLLQLIKVGYALFIEQILMRIGFMATSIMAASLSMEAMAAHQVGMNLLSLTFSFGDGMQVAAVALIGRSLGEGNPKKAQKYGMTCQFIGMCLSLVLALIYFIFGRPLFSLFFKETAIVDFGMQICRVIGIIVIFQISQVIFMGCLRGAGDTAYTAMASTISVTIIRTTFGYLLCYHFGLGLTGVWLGILSDQIGRFLFSSLRFRSGKWTKIHI